MAEEIEVEETAATAEPETEELENAEVSESEDHEVESQTDEEDEAEIRRKKAEKTQARINKLTRRAKEAEERAAALEAKLSETKPAEPRLEDFDTVDEYATALANHKLEAAKKPSTPAQPDYSEVLNSGAAKHNDFLETVQNPSLPLGRDMMDMIAECENGDDVLYSLAKNPVEFERISLLDPRNMAREIGRLEVIIGTKPKKISKAPAPSEPLKPTGPTDKNLSPEQWIAERNKQRRAAGKI